MLRLCYITWNDLKKLFAFLRWDFGPFLFCIGLVFSYFLWHSTQIIKNKLQLYQEQSVKVLENKHAVLESCWTSQCDCMPCLSCGVIGCHMGAFL